MKINIKKTVIKENIEIVVLALVMALVYGIRMFTNRPWYDELYTYYSFISRGPLYAAIHWPVPNNHVGYSVLSAFFDLSGNPYIGLRGVSFLASIANIVLIYVFVKRVINRCRPDINDRLYAFLAACIYAGSWIIHNLSVQGRGYTLSVTCFLTAGIMLFNICVTGCGRNSYIIFALSLILGMYIFPSAVYWVLPLCIVGGLFLLAKKQIKILYSLILSAVIAAVCVVFLYMIIWLAIGANLLCKNPQSAYYGLHQVKVILKAPLLSAGTGIDYMLASPYIQSIDRKSAVTGLPGYFKDFFNQCYAGMGIIIICLSFVIIIISIIGLIRKSGNNACLFYNLYITGILVLVPVMLMIQSVHPYKRVMSFICVPLSMGAAVLFKSLISLCKKERLRGIISVCVSVIIILAVGFGFTTYDYNGPVADRENDIADALADMEKAGTVITSDDSVFYTDDYQKYVLKFYYDAEPAEAGYQDADYIMVSKEMLDRDYTAYIWPMLVAYDEELLDYINDNFVPVVTQCENMKDNNYRVYRRVN